MTLRVRRISSIDELRALGPRYDEMVLASGDAGVFYQLAWLERAWPYYHARLGGSIAFLLAEDDGGMVGLAPLVRRTEGWTHARRRVLAFVGGTWDELDNWMPAFLFATPDPRRRAAVMTAFVDAIAQQSWDLLDLRFVRDSCPSRDALLRRFPELRDTRDRLTTPRIRLETGWAAYWADRSKRLRRILERGATRAAQDGLRLTYEVTAGIPAARRDEAAAIHRARQQQIRASGRPRSSPFDDPHQAQLFWSLIDWAASQGRLRTHWLRIGPETAAYVVALHHAGTTFAYFNAINPAAERYHPGNLVLASMVEREATDFGATIIDLMVGANLTKSLFATEELLHAQLAVVNPRLLRARASDAWVRAGRAAARLLRH